MKFDYLAAAMIRLDLLHPSSTQLFPNQQDSSYLFQFRSGQNAAAQTPVPSHTFP